MGRHHKNPAYVSSEWSPHVEAAAKAMYKRLRVEDPKKFPKWSKSWRGFDGSLLHRGSFGDWGIPRVGHQRNLGGDMTERKGANPCWLGDGSIAAKKPTPAESGSEQNEKRSDDDH